MSTIIRPCECNHTFQDKVYGKQKRVHNMSDTGAQITCTVCGEKKKVIK